MALETLKEYVDKLNQLKENTAEARRVFREKEAKIKAEYQAVEDIQQKHWLEIEEQFKPKSLIGKKLVIDIYYGAHSQPRWTLEQTAKKLNQEVLLVERYNYNAKNLPVTSNGSLFLVSDFSLQQVIEGDAEKGPELVWRIRGNIIRKNGEPYKEASSCLVQIDECEYTD